MANTNNGVVDEALAGMAANSPARQPMGTEAYENINVPSASPESGNLVPRAGVAAGDPAVQPISPKPGTLYDAKKAERMGATYGIPVMYTAQTAPEAAATQANGRIVKPKINRSRTSFGEGVATSY